MKEKEVEKMKPEPLTKEKLIYARILGKVGIAKVITLEDVKSAVQWLLKEIEKENSGNLPNPSFQSKLERTTYWLGFTDGYNHTKNWIKNLIKKAFSGVVEE